MNLSVDCTSADGARIHDWSISDVSLLTCYIKCRRQSRRLMQQLTEQPITSLVRSCSSPILSRWQFLHTHYRCRITNTATRRTNDSSRWAASTETVSSPVCISALKSMHCTREMAWWRCGLVIEKSRLRFAAGSQVNYTYMPLSTSCIIWYRCNTREGNGRLCNFPGVYELRFSIPSGLWLASCMKVII